MQSTELEDSDLQELARDLYAWSGHDFSGYAMDSFKRRVRRIMILEQVNNYKELHHRLGTEKPFLRHFIDEVSVGVTAMFRDPLFFKKLREEIIPILSGRPFLRIWHAGCSTGEEVFSLAILLHEAGLLSRSRIYATDVSAKSIQAAKAGVFPLQEMRQFSHNYIHSGGRQDFSKYYTANYGSARFDSRLSQQMLFSTHNLVSDRSFNEFDLLLCRNVLIYFSRELQQRVLTLLDESVADEGFLALGTIEDLRFSTIHSRYRLIDRSCRIWQKMPAPENSFQQR